MSDDAQEARHLFRLVSFLCSLVFGVPLAVILVKMTSELFGSPAGVMSYESALKADATYVAILSGLLLIPTLASYVYYRRLAHE